MTTQISLVIAVIGTVILSGLVCGSEIGIYQISRLRLRLGVEKKRISFVLLGRAMHDRTGLLQAIIVGSNLSQYLATSLVTYMLFSTSGQAHTAELFATAIMVPVLFVFSELVPKNIFFYRADSIMPQMGPVLYAWHKFLTLCGVLPLLKYISGFFSKLTGTAITAKTSMVSAQKHQMMAILEDIHEESFLSPVQTDLINRLAKITNIHVSAVMIGMPKVLTVEKNSNRQILREILKKSAFTRILVYEQAIENIIGFINIYEVLSANEEFSDLQKFVRPILRISTETVVSKAISMMQKENEKIVLVTRTMPGGQEKPVGIATMKDLVEELLGELSEW